MHDQAFLDANHVSASQVETFDLCERKWGLNKLDGHPNKSNQYAQRGHAVHHDLELWQRDGTPIDLSTDSGKIASAGLRFLPRPSTHDVEDYFLLRTATATYKGLKDLRSGASPIVAVYDHKTTVNFKWMKTPEKLRSNVQANLYAVDEVQRAASEGRHVERIELNWIYYLANPEKPKARKVQLHVLPDKNTAVPECPSNVEKAHFGIMYYDELYENFAKIEHTAARMVQLYADHPKAMDLPYNADACQAYGGCPYYKEQCTLTLGERIRSMEQQQSLSEKMKASVSKQATAPAAASATVPVVQGAADHAAAAHAVAAHAAVAKSAVKPSGGIPKLVNQIKKPNAPAAAALPTVNPPEEANGTDPDAPEGQQSATESTPATVPHVVGAPHAVNHLQVVVHMAQGIVAARLYPDGDARYAGKVAKLAVELAEALEAALAKK
jgi:hypothetical protein